MLKVISFQTDKIKNIKGADVLEFWFNRISKKSIAAILKKIKLPFIYKIENTNLKDINTDAIKKAKYIDIDVKTTSETIKEIKKINPKVLIIISYHNFKETPPKKDLEKILKEMKKKKADIVKFATMANDMVDNFRMLDFCSIIGKRGHKAICLCMGEKGRLTRLTGHLFGNYMMYFAQDEKNKTAPGQITIKEYGS